MNLFIILLYLAALILFGYLGKRRAKNTEDFRVAGRRLGPLLYTGTMSAVVLGGASTVGGVGLGYKFGISGMWLVVAIAAGVILLSLIFAPIISKLKIYTVSQMLSLRYGVRATQVSSVVMLAYTVMIAVTSTAAYASIFRVMFDMDRSLAILLGSLVVIGYSLLGGMWSITLTDMMQFAIMTVGIFLLMLPLSLSQAGGWSGLTERLSAEYFQLGTMGTDSIITMFVIYTLGVLVGQDIWQRVFSARSPEVARWGGTASGIYIALYGVAGAVIGMAAAVLAPGLESKDDAFATVAQNFLPVGLGGIVLAAGVAAMMSTASGALIAAATVARVDVLPFLTGKPAIEEEGGDSDEALKADRTYLLVIGLAVTGLAIFLTDTVTSLTIAYDILVGGLMVAILGGLLWRRGTGIAAAASMLVGSVATLACMPIFGVLANEPIYYGLASSLLVYVVASFATKPTAPEVMKAWDARLASRKQG
ncbi:MAG: sodium:solute symporter [Rothia sp. (in: high G+C Gram-positive bacteria)]|nr:sodium:solute symporter [Rothia sp. (in: high G+C Gram-positive bacteria)]